MNAARFLTISLLLAFIGDGSLLRAQTPPSANRRNVIIFVADGLRHGSINEQDAPTFLSVRKQGVDFRNSHSLFPTFTTGNASAIATGHALGDTGDFSNTIWLGYPSYDTGNFNLPIGSPIPFIENDQILADLDDHFHGNYLGEETLLSLAHQHGYNTAAIGKLGPTAIQLANLIAPVNGSFPPPASTIVVDDATGTSAGLPLPPSLLLRFEEQKLPPEAPARNNGYGAASQYDNGYSGDRSKPGTLVANTLQQQWFADVTTKAILPYFQEQEKPFILLFWSRDPDGTQHYQGDSLGTLFPGINGPTARAGVQNADHNLHQIFDWLDSHPKIKADTDIFLTSDHGFATVSRREIDLSGRSSKSEAAQHCYFDSSGKLESEKGVLPAGFLAIDLAIGLKASLFDPDRRSDTSHSPYKKLRLEFDAWERPVSGNGLLGDDVRKLDGSDAKAIVASNGGSDLIYVPDGRVDTVREITNLLLSFDYVGGVFVDDHFGNMPGTLPLSAINLVGSTALPRPAIVVALKVFYLTTGDLQTAVQVSDTLLQEGQGMHGGFGRDSTYNNMAAIGPDFKKGFVDEAPVSNADIVPTLARLLHFELKPKGGLQGRVAEEAFNRGSAIPAPPKKVLVSTPAGGLQTVLEYEELGGERYLHSACMARARTGMPASCP